MEGDIIKKTNNLISLREQNLVDYEHQSNGRGGGLEIEAFTYTVTHGINTETGPILVEIDASCKSFHFYLYGLYYDKIFKKLFLNHAVLTIGYYIQDNDDYYIEKTRLCKNRDMSGYVKIAGNP